MYHASKILGDYSKENPTSFKPRSCLDGFGRITKTHCITQHLLIEHVNIRQPCTQACLDANINTYGVHRLSSQTDTSQTIYLSTRLLT